MGHSFRAWPNRSSRTMTTVTPAQPTFFWAPAKMSPNCTLPLWERRVRSQPFETWEMFSSMSKRRVRKGRNKWNLFCCHLWYIYGPWQEVGGHVADEDHAVGFRREVVLHTMDRLVAAVVHIRCGRVQGPAAGVGNFWRKHRQNKMKAKLIIIQSRGLIL